MRNGSAYAGSEPAQVERMVELAQRSLTSRIKPPMDNNNCNGMYAADFGSGDGRIVRALAESGFYGVGYENDPLLAIWSSWALASNSRATVHWQSFWTVNCEKFDVIFVYQWDVHMEKLEPKLRKEMKPGAVVISNAFTFSDWEQEAADEELGLYVYRVP